MIQPTGVPIYTMKELLNETIETCYGDTEDPDTVFRLSLFIFERDWYTFGTIVFEDNEYMLIKHHIFPTLELGKRKTFKINGYKKEVFEIIFRVEMKIDQEHNYIINNEFFARTSRGHKISRAVYSYLINELKFKINGNNF